MNIKYSRRRCGPDNVISDFKLPISWSKLTAKNLLGISKL